MKKVFFICDESEAKGYSDNREKYPREIGVVAGFVVPEEHLEKMRSDLDTISSQYLAEKKLHVTDLSPNNQESLREEIFTYLKRKKIPCLYEAIHSEGFYLQYESTNELKRKSYEQRRSKIKMSKNQTKKLLHEELFRGAFGKAVTLCDYISGKFHLAVITDTVDESIKKKFVTAANELLSYGKSGAVKTVTGFNQDKNEIVRRQITSKIKDPANLLGDFSRIEFSIECEDSSLTLAAHFIANSLPYHFKCRDGKSIGNKLNSKKEIKGHPLECLFYGLDSNYFADAFFMHPKY